MFRLRLALLCVGIAVLTGGTILGVPPRGGEMPETMTASAAYSMSAEVVTSGIEGGMQTSADYSMSLTVLAPVEPVSGADGLLLD